MFELFSEGGQDSFNTSTTQSRDLKLSKAVVNNSQVELNEGYTYNSYICPETHQGMDYLQIAASEDIALDLFGSLVDVLGSKVGVILRSSHDGADNSHCDFCVEHIDLTILSSTLQGSTKEGSVSVTSTNISYLDLLLNDGHTGFAITTIENEPGFEDELSFQNEVQLNCNKTIYVYGDALKRFEKVIQSYGITRDQEMDFIDLVDHTNVTSPEYREAFHILSSRLGAVDEDMT